MRLRGLAGAVALAAVLSVSACSSGPSSDGSAAPAASGSGAPTADATTPAAPATPATPSAGGPSTPGALATLPAEQCLTGRYALARFVAVGDGSTYGTGQGGDVTLTFEGDGYTLAGAGRKPVVVTLAGQTGNLRVDGTSKGTYALDGETATFTAGSSSGSGTLDNGSGGDRARLTMKQVDAVIGLAGQGQVACTDQVMTITLAAIRLELVRA